MKLNEMMKELIVSISKKNSKMGDIWSVSLPPIITCKHCETCAGKCYAVRMMKWRESIKEAWKRNLKILKADRDSYFQQVKAAAITQLYFRWHVSGDIVDQDYLHRMCKVARECKYTRFLAFTKNYEDVNAYLDTHKKPRNLQIVFSIPFNGAPVPNPHNLPTAVVILKGQKARDNWKICGGNCAQCNCRGIGCWELKKGETVAFPEH